MCGNSPSCSLLRLSLEGCPAALVPAVQSDPRRHAGRPVSTAASPTGQASDLHEHRASDLTNSVGDATNGVTGSVNNAVEDVARTP